MNKTKIVMGFIILTAVLALQVGAATVAKHVTPPDKLYTEVGRILFQVLGPLLSLVAASRDVYIAQAVAEEISATGEPAEPTDKAENKKRKKAKDLWLNEAARILGQPVG